MNKRYVLVAAGLTTVGALVGFGVKALADGIPSPNPLYYSGTLTEGGKPVDGMRAVTVNLWPDGTTAGTPLCQTVASTTNVVGGRFRIALATTCKTAINQNNNAYVEVIDGATSLGRAPMGAVPYAVEADRASGAAGALATQVVPSGAVMAFNLSAYPTGWSVFTNADGRAIIGVNASGGNGLSQRNLGDTVGEEAHTQSVAEMPSHAHDLLINGAAPIPVPAAGGYWGINWTNVGVYESVPATQPTDGAGFQNFMTIQPTGGGNAFNQMQPSLALLYCQKN